MKRYNAAGIVLMIRCANMNTLQHGFWLYFATHKHPRVWHYVLGAVFPDLIYILGFLYLLSIKQVFWENWSSWCDPAVGISFLRGLPWVGYVEFTGHSLLIWLVALLASLLPVFRRARDFIFGWGSHILLDVFTHVQHAPYLLYPLSWRQFPIGVSYWDKRYHSMEFQWIQGVLTSLAVSYLVYEYYNARKGKKINKRKKNS